MKISQQQLKQIITEEVERALKEVNPVPTPDLNANQINDYIKWYIEQRRMSGEPRPSKEEIEAVRRYASQPGLAGAVIGAADKYVASSKSQAKCPAGCIPAPKSDDAFRLPY